ncbi:hypothetical protein B5G11_13005, partial [Drancourtella sp. An57]
IWLTVRELVQLERITFRAVPLYSGLLFFRSESDTFLMNYIISVVHHTISHTDLTKKTLQNVSTKSFT